MRGVLLLAMAGLIFTMPATARPVLEKVVILQRHGVRAPTKAPADLADYASQPWAGWPVQPGELTDHGFAGVTRMGDALRLHYGALLPKACAKAAVFVWADNADQRTRRSGEAMAAALAPGCGLTAAMATGEDDPMFHAADKVCPFDPAKAEAALGARLDTVLAAERGPYDSARARLQSILKPDSKAQSCSGDVSKACVIAADRNSIKGGKLSGTLSDGSTLSENLFLEYAQGVTAPGWGRMSDASALAAIMPLHRIYSDLARRTPYLAAHGGTLLARQIRAALTPTPDFAHEAPVPAQAKFILLAGHDTNLANLAGMLGLDWVLPGEPDVTAPDTALAFEVWRDGKAQYVRLRLFYQTPDQLRNLTRFDAAHPVPQRALTLPGCAEKCALDKMVAALDAAIVPECIAAP